MTRRRPCPIADQAAVQSISAAFLIRTHSAAGAPTALAAADEARALLLAEICRCRERPQARTDQTLSRDEIRSAAERRGAAPHPLAGWRAGQP